MHDQKFMKFKFQLLMYGKNCPCRKFSRPCIRKKGCAWNSVALHEKKRPLYGLQLPLQEKKNPLQSFQKPMHGKKPPLHRFEDICKRGT